MSKYVLTILPSPEVTEFAESFYRDFPQHCHTTLPPHLTILPPFSLNNLNEESFLSLLVSSLKNFSPFIIDLEKVGDFRGSNNVVFLSPSPKSNEKIYALVKKILSNSKLNNSIVILDKRSEDPESIPISTKKFISHLTLANQIPREVFPQIFLEAQTRFKPMSFSCDSVVLFRNLGDGWKKLSDINF